MQNFQKVHSWKESRILSCAVLLCTVHADSIHIGISAAGQSLVHPFRATASRDASCLYFMLHQTLLFNNSSFYSVVITYVALRSHRWYRLRSNEGTVLFKCLCTNPNVRLHYMSPIWTVTFKLYIYKLRTQPYTKKAIAASTEILWPTSDPSFSQDGSNDHWSSLAEEATSHQQSTPLSSAIFGRSAWIVYAYWTADNIAFAMSDSESPNTRPHWSRKECLNLWQNRSATHPHPRLRNLDGKSIRIVLCH